MALFEEAKELLDVSKPVNKAYPRAMAKEDKTRAGQLLRMVPSRFRPPAKNIRVPKGFQVVDNEAPDYEPVSGAAPARGPKKRSSKKATKASKASKAAAPKARKARKAVKGKAAKKATKGKAAKKARKSAEASEGGVLAAAAELFATPAPPKKRRSKKAASASASEQDPVFRSWLKKLGRAAPVPTYTKEEIEADKVATRSSKLFESLRNASPKAKAKYLAKRTKLMQKGVLPYYYPEEIEAEKKATAEVARKMRQKLAKKGKRKAAAPQGGPVQIDPATLRARLLDVRMKGMEQGILPRYSAQEIEAERKASKEIAKKLREKASPDSGTWGGLSPDAGIAQIRKQATAKSRAKEYPSVSGFSNADFQKLFDVYIEEREKQIGQGASPSEAEKKAEERSAEEADKIRLAKKGK